MLGNKADEIAEWWEQYKMKTSSWDERRGELESNHESEDDSAVGDENSVVRGVL